MKNATRQKLAVIAREQAQKPFHGYIEGKESNIAPIIKYFPKWNLMGTKVALQNMLSRYEIYGLLER